MIKNILEYFEKILADCSDKIAVIDGEREIAFGDLAHMAWSVGMGIYKYSRGQIKQPIAVFLPKTIECIATDIGIVYSGNAYMNLDVKNPVERISNILQLIKPLYVITDTKGKEKLSVIFANSKILLVDELVTVQDEHTVLLNNLKRIIDTDPLCLINTSGSTGTPKSVVLNHKSFIDFTEWALDTMSWSKHEVIGSLSPAVFDIYSFELCLLMSKAAQIVIVPDRWAAFPVKILQLINEKKITYLFWVPTIMVNIANMGLLDKVELPSLQMIWFAGEVFPTKQFNIWRRRLPEVTFVNMYGPIEITLDCTYYIVNRNIADDEPIPIGYPCRNTDVFLLTDDNTLAESHEAGELCVRGTSLALGYYNNPEKTAAVFVQNPLNHSYPELIYRTGDIVTHNDKGELVFLGRKDSLIKHYGYRIELSEIEHIIVNKLQIVKNACVIYDHGKKEIVLIYEAEQEKSPREMRQAIMKELPNYMIPTRYIYMDILPRNTNGKIDRMKLKNMLSD